ncbi:unnamed protein product [Mesocestoides corti]|uniref:LSM-interacting domain-containing protein n=1 Tax=Mesocestoides corti TaxID=53468 RepID=A0A0R3U9C4_MESCO|nr:unnamed protein product [Mesocestoides corti]
MLSLYSSANGTSVLTPEKGELSCGGFLVAHFLHSVSRSHARSHLSFMPRALCRFPASGGANQHSSSAAASSSSEEPSVDTFKAPVAPKSNDDFRKMFLKQ